MESLDKVFFSSALVVVVLVVVVVDEELAASAWTELAFCSVSERETKTHTCTR